MPESNAPEERSGGQHSQFAWMLEQLTDVFLGAGGKSPGQAAMIDGIFASAAGKLEAPALAALCAQLGHRLAELPLLSQEIARLRAPSQASEWAAASAVIALPVQPAVAEGNGASAEVGEAHSAAANISSPDCAFHGLTDPSAQIHLARAADAATLGRIARSPGLTEAMTTILVSRGSRSVLHAVTANPTAQFAKSCFTTLAELAPSDRALRENLALRADLPEAILGKLMPFLPEALKARALAGEPAMPIDDRLAVLRQAEQAAASRRPGSADAALRHCAERADLPGSIDALAHQLEIPRAAALALTANRFDHAVCLAVKAAGASDKALLAVIDMRRRCAIKLVSDTRSALRVFAALTQEAALQQVMAIASCVAADARPAHAELRPRLAAVA